MAMMSKKRLLAFLTEHGYGNRVSYEAYGRKVMAYVKVKDMAVRNELTRHLQSLAQKVNVRYSPGSPVVEVQVTYFKAWHWDE
jgi:hypothetical protein